MLSLSVVICTYNGERFIKEQIESILGQTREIDEIVLCDDGSTDKTIAVAKEVFATCGFDRYRILGPGPTRGVAVNFLRGMKASTGDYVFTCDQDDVWLPDKVAIFVEEMERSGKQLYFSDGYVVNADLSKRDYSLWSALGFSMDQLEKKTMLSIILSGCVVTGAAMAVSRDLINQIDEIPDCWLHDGWFAAVAICNDSIQPIDSKTFLYRQHGANAVGAQSNSLWENIKSYTDNISKQKQVRKQRYARYECIRQGCSCEDAELKKCISFWGELCDMEEKKKFSSLMTIVRLFREGSYDKYYTGFRGAMRDVLSLFFAR